ncbi:hypothetical protein GLYMA_04G121601v4 [Glycine max]|nr:hypothetical protein GLYMA_04G121601v4 [Glycine max]KAH1111022.1 hypothetical protein GYH30_009696 [Glycine max]
MLLYFCANLCVALFLMQVTGYPFSGCFYLYKPLGSIFHFSVKLSKLQLLAKMVTELINVNPIIYEKKERRAPSTPHDEYDVEPIDQQEVFDILFKKI